MRLAYFSAADGYRFAVRVWDAPRPRGRVIVLHGIVSHGGWYESICEFLNDAGLEVHALDRRGSGLNQAARGDVDSYATWLSDVTSYWDKLQRGVPTVLAGISWGGKLAIAVARHRPEMTAGVAMICPGLYARQQAGAAARWMLRLATRAGFGGCRVSIPLRNPRLFTATPEWQAFIRRDPLRLRRLTIRCALADEALTADARADAEQVRLPILLMLAGGDRIVDNARTRQFFARLGTTEKTILEYTGAGHTLEFEPRPERYLLDLRAWIEAVVQSHPGRPTAWRAPPGR